MSNNNDEYMQGQKNKFEDYAEKYRAEANEVFRELVRQLILAATVFISVVPYVLSKADVLSKFTVLDKHLFMFALILLGLSIPMGIVQLIVDHYFFRTWHGAKYRIVEGISNGKITSDNISKKSAEIQSPITTESSTAFVWLQIVFVVMGLLLLLWQLSKGVFIV